MKITRIRWTRREEDRLGRMWAKGLSISIIGEKLGRRRRAITARAMKLDLPPHWTRWSRRDDAELRRRWKAGESAADIGKALSRTLSAVFTRAQALELPRRRWANQWLT